MKILHIINSLTTAGAEKIVVDLLPILQKKTEVSILVLQNSGNDNFIHKLKANNINIYTLNARNIYNPLLVFSLIKYLNKHDIIHVHLFPAQYWVAIASFFCFKKVKLITTEHSSNNRRLNKWYFKWPEKFIYAQYQKIIGISEHTTNALIKWLTSKKEKIITIPNGINLTNFANAHKIDLHQKLKIAQESKLLIMVARFIYPKDQATVIKAMAFLPKNCHLLLVGDGPLREKCEHLAQEINVSNQIHFLGIRNDIPNLLKSSNIAILSSAYEGLSLSSIEPMAAGIPIVASDVTGLKEVIDQVGILFPFQDEKILAKEIQKLLEDNDYYQKIAARCLEKAKQYSIDKMADAYFYEYQKLLA